MHRCQEGDRNGRRQSGCGLQDARRHAKREGQIGRRTEAQFPGRIHKAEPDIPQYDKAQRTFQRIGRHVRQHEGAKPCANSARHRKTDDEPQRQVMFAKGPALPDIGQDIGDRENRDCERQVEHQRQQRHRQQRGADTGRALQNSAEYERDADNYDSFHIYPAAWALVWQPSRQAGSSPASMTASSLIPDFEIMRPGPPRPPDRHVWFQGSHSALRHRSGAPDPSDRNRPFRPQPATSDANSARPFPTGSHG